MLVNAQKLARQMKNLGRALEARRVEGAVVAGAKIFADAATSKAGGVSRRIASDIAVSSLSSGGKASVGVGLKGATSWFWHFVEFGTSSHQVEVSSRKVLAGGGEVYGVRAFPRGVRARPIFRPAYDATKTAVIRKIADESRILLREAV